MPATGVDRLPGVLAQRAKGLLARGFETHARAHDGVHEQLAVAREAVEGLPAEDLAKVLTHPLFSKWALWDGQTTDIAPLDVNRLWLSSLIRHGTVPDQGLLVPLSAGTLRGPGLRPSRVAADPDEPMARIRLDGGRARLDAGPHRQDMASGRLLHRGVRPVPDSDLVLDAGDPVFQGFLARMNAVAGAGSAAQRDLRPVTDPGPDLIDAYRVVLTQLRDCWPEAADELVRYVRVVVPFESRLLLGWATPLFQGAVFVRAVPEDLLFTFERLVHEAAHLRLFAIQHTGRLHDDPPDKLLMSPARRDPRPVIGVIHAAFVYGRLSEAFARAVDHGADDSWSARLEVLVERYWMLSHTLHTEASLTPLGSEILDALDARLSAVFGGRIP